MLSSQHIHFFSKSVAVFFSSPHNTKYRTPTHPLFNSSRKNKAASSPITCAAVALILHATASHHSKRQTSLRYTTPTLQSVACFAFPFLVALVSR